MDKHHRDVRDFLSGLRRRQTKKEDQAPTFGYAQGEIIAVDGATDTVTITVGGGTTEIPEVRHFSFYSPTVGDIVWIVMNGSDYHVLGDLA